VSLWRLAWDAVWAASCVSTVAVAWTPGRRLAGPVELVMRVLAAFGLLIGAVVQMRAWGVPTGLVAVLAAVQVAPLLWADKQVMGELGWAGFQVRSDRAIRRHWMLVCCAFSFCWQAFLADHPTLPAPPDSQAAPTVARGASPSGHRPRTRRQELLAGGVAGGAGLADPLERAGALLAVVVASAAAPAAATAA
jgi:hypothetical protein